MKLFRGDRIKFSERVAKDHPGSTYSAADRYVDFAQLFATPQGRRVLSQILIRCQLWERSHTLGDSHATAHKEGMRDVGLWLMETINMEPGILPAQNEYEEPDG